MTYSLDKLKARLKREKRLEQMRAYNASPAGKLAQKLYKASKKGRMTRKQRRQTRKQEAALNELRDDDGKLIARILPDGTIKAVSQPEGKE